MSLNSQQFYDISTVFLRICIFISPKPGRHSKTQHKNEQENQNWKKRSTVVSKLSRRQLWCNANFTQYINESRVSAKKFSCSKYNIHFDGCNVKVKLIITNIRCRWCSKKFHYYLNDRKFRWSPFSFIRGVLYVCPFNRRGKHSDLTELRTTSFDAVLPIFP
jgi:hypothetical protein